MSKVKMQDLEEYVQSHGGTLEKLTNGNYNIRNGLLSRNIGKPMSSNKWETAQLLRAWGDATGIPNPRW